MDVGDQCLLIAFQPESHFHALERIDPMKFHDTISATEISSQFNIQHFYVFDMWTVKIAGFIKAEEKVTIGAGGGEGRGDATQDSKLQLESRNE